MSLTPRAADLDHFEYQAEETAHRALQSQPVVCDGCDELTTRDTVGALELPEGVLCPCCARRLASAFMPEILAAAGQTRWGSVGAS